MEENSQSSTSSGSDTHGDTDSDEGTDNKGCDTRKKKKKYYHQKFRKQWMTEFDFIIQKLGETYCTVCNTKLSGGIFHIKRHAKGNHHINR